jgi:SPP1 gp7 family putative phage head morphogenesis protein
LPEEITASVRVTDIFDAALLKVDKAFRGSVKDVAIAPTLSDVARRRIALEWQSNLERWIKDFADEEVEKLRQGIKENAFRGNRFESSVETIKRSFGVTERKAKFLARQETGLLMAKFKEARYTESGIHEYTWRCVAGSAAHPVRPSHKALDGKVFRFDTPPITTAPDEPTRRNNPGEDFNCRCHAVPRVKV